MGFQYNGKLRPPELLLRPDGTLTLMYASVTIARRLRCGLVYLTAVVFPLLCSRRREGIDDLFRLTVLPDDMRR